MNINLFLFSAAVLGIVLIYFFSPQNDFLASCNGDVKANGTLVKTFFSKNKNVVGIFKSSDKEFLVNLDEFVDTPKNAEISGRASNYNDACWIFPDEIIWD